MYLLTVGLIPVNTLLIFSQVIVFDFYLWKIISWYCRIRWTSIIIWTTQIKRRYKPHANKIYHLYYLNYHGHRSLYILWTFVNYGKASPRAKHFGKCKTSGCLFHFCQAIYRNNRYLRFYIRQLSDDITWTMRKGWVICK